MPLTHIKKTWIKILMSKIPDWKWTIPIGYFGSQQLKQDRMYMGMVVSVQKMWLWIFYLVNWITKAVSFVTWTDEVMMAIGHNMFKLFPYIQTQCIT